jgi:hypothetical protein
MPVVVLTMKYLKRDDLQNTTARTNCKYVFVTVFKDMPLFIEYLIKNQELKLGMFFIQLFNYPGMLTSL